MTRRGPRAGMEGAPGEGVLSCQRFLWWHRGPGSGQHGCGKNAMLEGTLKISLLKVMLRLFPSGTGIFGKNGGQKSARVRNHPLSAWKQRRQRNSEREENCFVFPPRGLGGGQVGVSLLKHFFCVPRGVAARGTRRGRGAGSRARGAHPGPGFPGQSSPNQPLF